MPSIRNVGHQASFKAVLFLTNTFFTQEFVVDGYLNLSSVLKLLAVPLGVCHSHAQFRGESEAFLWIWYKTRDSPSHLSSLRFYPYSLVYNAYIYRYFWPGRSTSFRISVTTPLFCHSSLVTRPSGQSCERNEGRKTDTYLLSYCFSNFLTIFACTVYLLLVTFQKGGRNSANCFR